MSKTNSYLTPEVKTVQIHLEGSVLIGSTERSIASTGEDATLGETYNPWN